MKFSLSTIAFIVFVILKLTDTVAWSWWWVASPLWISAGLWLLYVFVVGFIAGVITGIARALLATKRAEAMQRIATRPRHPSARRRYR